MYTRNQLKPIINFDEASMAWKSNKIYLGNGTYKYKPNICIGNTKNGIPCKTKCSNKNNLYCWHHQKS
jgi:hypothetical protein